MNALELNGWTKAWRELAARMPRPRAVLAVSAHWYTPGGRVTVNEQPPTIHDFGGFPPALSAVQYPAPGSPELAERVAELMAPMTIAQDPNWGLDHGTWSVLVHLFPDADIPVVQLGLDETLDPAQHYALATALRVLREEGVLVFGSGNVVHNLEAYAWGRQPVEPFDWAVRFEAALRGHIEAGRVDDVVAYEDGGPDAALSVPTPEHYLPLLYVLGVRHPNEPVSFPVVGFDGGSVSMLSVQVG
jgi:4,5-DOPA dioxygenase extradiol